MVSHVLCYSIYFYVICFQFTLDDVDVASYTNHNTPSHGKLPTKILEKPECVSRNIFEWFFNNTMKVNPDKCHFLSSLDSNPKVSISSFDIENTNSQKFLGITIDCKLNFLNHVSNLCEKVDPKVGAMGRIFPLILLNQRKLIIKVILMSQFDYCLLLLINHNKTLNN